MRTVEQWFGEYGESHTQPAQRIAALHLRAGHRADRHRLPVVDPGAGGLRRSLALAQLGHDRHRRLRSSTTSPCRATLGHRRRHRARRICSYIVSWLDTLAWPLWLTCLIDLRRRLDRAVHRPLHRRQAPLVLQGRAVPADRPDCGCSGTCTGGSASRTERSGYHRAMLNPLDLYDVRGLLTEDERAVQDSVGRFVDEKVLPIIQDCFEKHHFPKELIPEIAELGLLGSSIHGLRLRRPERGQLRTHLPGTRARRFGHPQLRLRAELAVHVPDLRLRQRRAEAALAARHGARPEDRLLRPHRTARRLRSFQHEDAREEERRRLGHQRLEDVDHQRRHRRPVHLLGDDGRRHPRLHRRERHEGFRGAGDRTQVFPARLGHVGTVLRQRRGARSQPAARREGTQGTAVLPHAGALRHHLGCHRRGAGLPRAAASTTRRRA